MALTALLSFCSPMSPCVSYYFITVIENLGRYSITAIKESPCTPWVTAASALYDLLPSQGIGGVGGGFSPPMDQPAPPTPSLYRNSYFTPLFLTGFLRGRRDATGRGSAEWAFRHVRNRSARVRGPELNFARYGNHLIRAGKGDGALGNQSTIWHRRVSPKTWGTRDAKTAASESPLAVADRELLLPM